MPDSHGSFSFHIIEDVMLITAAGAWNLECVEAYITEAERIYAETGSVRMHLVIFFNRWDGATPDAIARLVKYTRDCLARDMFRSQTYFHRESPFLSRMVMSFFAAAGNYEQRTFFKREDLLLHIAARMSPERLSAFTALFDTLAGTP